jgi:imidazolonepropionase-like amidohydrolase
MAGGGVASPTDPLTSTQFTPEEMRAITTAAQDAGTFATAHAYYPHAIRRAVEAGAKGIEHGNMLDGPTAQLLADKKVYLTPTLITYAAMADPKYAGFLPPANAAKNAEVLEKGLESVRLAHDAGVRMCLGTDLLSYLGVEQLREFGLRAEAGLTPAEVLRHATVNPAEMLGQEERLGQIKEGFLADLLVLNSNPLADVTVFERPEKHLLGVIKEGRVFASRWSLLPVDVEPKKELLECHTALSGLEI